MTTTEYGWQPKGGGAYEGTGALAGRASVYRRGPGGCFVLKLDGKSYELGKRATFDHAEAVVRRVLEGK